jgi:hypothetical protein
MQVLIVLLKSQTIKKFINNKIRLTHQKSLHTFVVAIPKRYMNKYVSLPP